MVALSLETSQIFWDAAFASAIVRDDVAMML
jgi:hypothetical protein